MPRIRSVKPGFFSSLDIADLAVATRLHFVGLWTYADDQGRGVDDPRLIKAALWPLDTDITPEDVEEMQAELAACGRIVRYEADGRRYFEIVNWHDHQKPNRPQDSTYPSPTDPDSVRVSDHDTPTEDTVSPHADGDEDRVQEGRGEEGRGEDSSAGGLAAALSTACGQDRFPAEGTRARTQLEVAAAEIARQGGEPHDVPIRTRVFHAQWPEAIATPMAIAKHWPQLVPRRDPGATHDPGRNDRAAALAAAGLTDTSEAQA